MDKIANNLAGVWIVVLVSGAIWGAGYGLQRVYDKNRVLGETVRCRCRVCRLLGVGVGRDTLYIRPAFAQVVGILCLVAGLVEVWLCGTFRALVIAGAILAIGLLLWALIAPWAMGRP